MVIYAIIHKEDKDDHYRLKLIGPFSTFADALFYGQREFGLNEELPITWWVQALETPKEWQWLK